MALILRAEGQRSLAPTVTVSILIPWNGKPHHPTVHLIRKIAQPSVMGVISREGIQEFPAIPAIASTLIPREIFGLQEARDRSTVMS